MSKYKIWLLLLATSTLAYGVSLRYGFSQDDWFHLTISQANTIPEFLNFFNPIHVSWIFFRPLSTQLPYWLSTTLFPLAIAPYFMHLMMLIIHTINGYLVVQIGKSYLNQKLATLLGIIYLLSNIHFLSLFYIGAIQQLISTLFSLLAILLVIQKKRSSLLISIYVLLALLSKELALRLPIILLIISFYQHGNIGKALRSNLGPLLVVGIYFSMRFLIGSVSASEYLISLSPSTTIATVMWYLLFLLGYPEAILTFGLSKGLVDFPAFFAANPFTRLPILLAVVPILFLLATKFIQVAKSKFSLSSFYFPILSIVSLSPILFLPTHRYPHYLDLALVFMGIWILSQYKSLTNRGVILALTISIGMISSIWVDVNTHWTTKRALESSRQIGQILSSNQCNSPSGVVISGKAEEVRDISYALSLENGPRIICQNPLLKVQYLILP